MEFIKGTTLEEMTIHQSDQCELLDKVATQLKRLHSYPIPISFEKTNMLWFSLDVMLKGTSRRELQEEYSFHASLITPLLQNTLCLGHGDFKPSNVIHGSDGLRFIDYELSGLHYRGFDVAKFFRTDSAKRNCDNFEYFLNSYINNNGNGNEHDVEALRLEAELLEPLTVRTPVPMIVNLISFCSLQFLLASGWKLQSFSIMPHETAIPCGRICTLLE